MTYTPDAGYFGGDSFTYGASDGTAAADPGTVSITVTRAPSCDDISRTTAAGDPVSVPLTCTDPEGDALTLAIEDGPSKGSLGTISGGAVTYTPDPGEFGADTFTYTASDGAATSAPATATITITRPPSCQDVARRTAAGSAVNVPLTCTDPDGDPLTLAIADGPSKGSLGAISGGAVTYTADGGEFGTDTFTYGASDGTAASAPATVTITITRPPACDDVSVRTAVGAPVEVPLACSDPDAGDSLTYLKVTDPSKGSLGAISGSTVTYTPAARRVRGRLVHVPRDRRNGRFRAGDGARHDLAPAGVRRHLAGRPRGHAGEHPADLHRPRRRRAHALGGRRAERGHARAGLRRRGHLHARCRRRGRRLVHVPRLRRRRRCRRPPPSRSRSRTRRPVPTWSGGRRSAPRSRSR